MHSPETRQKFIELRATTQSIATISSSLGVAQSTLRLWEKDDALEIARLRRINWEDAEDKVGITLEDRLRRMAEWINGAEHELETRHFDLMNNRDLMRFLRESRREYFRLRAMLFSAEHTLERTHRARANERTRPAPSVTPDVRRGLISQKSPANQAASSADAAHDSQSTDPDSITDKIGALADFPPTQPRNTNDLQQPKSSPADFSPIPGASGVVQSQTSRTHQTDQPEGDSSSLVIDSSFDIRHSSLPSDPSPLPDMGSIVVSPYECLQSVLQKYLEAETIHAPANRQEPLANPNSPI